uniref:alpha/beta hydrolase family esterase n=1 Tax=uncultured Albimonas sp. TaxID=1331701 RepID=UPI0030EF3BEB
LAALERAEPFRDWLRVYPEGGSRTWNAGRRRVDGGEAVRIPDVAFLRALAGKLAQDGLADPSRIVLAGFGEGGAMVLRTLCEAPGLAMGAAIVGASWPASLHCGQGRPTPILVFNGTEDPAVPFHGGQSRSDRKVGAGALASVGRTISSLSALNDCRAPLDETLPGGLGRKRIWFACQAPMMQWLIARMGHRWPGAPDQGREGDGFGPPAPAGAPDATLLIAGFFVSLVERPGP